MGQQEAEEEAELLSTIRREHIDMKMWYNDSKSPQALSLHGKYGPTYPAFWKDVVNWDGWKETRKAYLHYLSLKESGGSVSEQQQPAPTQRKRRSRWAKANDDNNNNSETAAASAEPAPKRRSRWARGRDETPVPSSTNAAPNAAPDANSAVLAALGIAKPSSNPSSSNGVLDILPGLQPTNLTPEQRKEMSQLQSRLRIANERLSNLEIEAARIDALPRDHPDRSPSPPPVYGTDGKRINTRAVRWKEKYTSERQDCLERMMDLNPNIQVSGFVRRKRTKKIYIPVDEHPTYNFIGLIIGPRGKTQKEMEAKTNCKIAIRGKGSIKEGARGRRDGKPMEGDFDPLHVVITGDDQGSVDAAADMIQQMLIVIDDDQNIHKQNQLRELALLNGTLKDEEFCHLCAEKGHRSFECPKRFAMNNKSIAGSEVKCAICGDTSHPTRDCTMKNKLGTEGGADGNVKKDQGQLDSDYQSFMAELDGKPPPTSNMSTAGSNAGATTPAVSGLVTTISSSTIKPGGEASTAAATPSSSSAAVTNSTATGVTTISSSVITTIAPTHVVKPGTTTGETSTLIPPPPPGGPPPTSQLPAGLPPPPPGGPPSTSTGAASSTPNNGLPPPPPGGPPPPPPPVATGAASTTGTSLPPPPPPPPAASSSADSAATAAPSVAGLPPPPPPPPPPAQGQQQQQPPYQGVYQQPYNSNAGWNGGNYQQQQHYPQQQQCNQYQQQQQHGSYYNNSNGKGDDETEGWDPRSYFGTEATGGDASGAGGFNWWEQ